MSQTTPPSDGSTNEPDWDTAPTPAEASPGGAGGGRRRVAIIAAASVAVAAVLGGGAYAAMTLFGGGPQPTDALPASTLAVMTVDLDPSATQKIAAIRTLRKFPGLKQKAGLGEKDDLRQYLFDKATENGACTSLSYAKDIKPWLGDRAAFGAVDLGGKTPAPVVAVQVSDADKARTGIEAVVKCGKPGNDFGFTVSNGYALISDSTAHAQTIAAEAKRSPLTDDAGYQKWSDEAGDSGVLSFYVAKRAAGYLADNVDRLSGLGLFDGSKLSSGSGSGGLSDPAAYHPGTARSDDDPSKVLKDSLKKFQGLAGTVRFAGGGVEVEVAGGFGAELSSKDTVGAQIERLPQDTALAAGLSVPKDYAKKVTEQLNKVMGSAGASMISEAQDQLGITLPEDLQTLLGSSLAISVGGKAPARADDITGPEDLPLGLTITGDPAGIKDVIAKIEAATGMHLADAQVVTRSSGKQFTLATSSDYADQLQTKGSLGTSSAFTEVVPEADKASGVVYVNFDTAWTDLVADSAGGGTGADSTEANLKPLKALGLSTWVDGGATHVLLKITTD